jgi:hypothetical protein
LFIYLFVYFFICLFIFLFIYLFIYLFFYLFVYLFIYLFIYLLFPAGVTTRVVDCITITATVQLHKRCMAVAVLKAEPDKLDEKSDIHITHNRYT